MYDFCKKNKKSNRKIVPYYIMLTGSNKIKFNNTSNSHTRNNRQAQAYTLVYGEFEFLCED